MATIGFLRYEDFLDELKETAGEGQVVRIETIHNSLPTNTPPLKIVRNSVIAAAQVGDVTLVAYFIIGETNSLSPERVQLAARLTEHAGRLLGEDLEANGFSIRKGIVAGTLNVGTECYPGQLWTEQTLRSLDELSQGQSS